MDGSASPTVPISAIEHYEYCARQCALIHVDGIWAENPHTVRGQRAHRRVDDHSQSRTERNKQVLRAVPLWSEQFGLSGRADVVEVLEDETVRPVEYKSGIRHGLTADLQVCAQAEPPPNATIASKKAIFLQILCLICLVLLVFDELWPRQSPACSVELRSNDMNCRD